MQNRTIRAAMLGASSAAAIGVSLAMSSGGVALAQDTPLVQDRVVVTGSRIARRDFQANSPIVTVDQATFENRSSFSVEAALNQLPQFTPGQSQNLASGAGTPFVSANAAPGAATLNLRGLDANRSLVLVNGRRPQPVNAQLVVDVNTIPSAAVQNVEVITGGAAAVYGADAIAGVVNFILRDNFEGIEVDGQYGLSQEGDNEQSQVSVLIGGNFADGRGNAMVGGSWSQRGKVYQRDHDFYTRGWNDPRTNAGGINNSVPGITQVAVGPVTYGVNPDGTLFNITQANNPAAPNKWPLNSMEEGSGFKLLPKTNPAALYNGLGYNDPEAQLSVPLTRYSAFSSAHYDLTDSITAFMDFNYTHTITQAISLVPPAFNFWSLTIPYTQANDDPDSPTFGANRQNFHPVSRQLADLLNSRPAAVYCLFGSPGCSTANATADDVLVGTPTPNQPWVLTRSLDFLGRLRTDTTSNVFQFTSGLRGDFAIRDWTWEVYGSHGETDIMSQQLNGSISQENLQQIINGRATGFGAGVNNGVVTEGPFTATGPWGQGWNNGGQVATVTGCTTGIPIFNADGSVPTGTPVVSQDCIDYATLRTNNSTHLEQNIVEATMQGGLFDNWAGEIRFALGATYRDNSFSFNPDASQANTQQRANVINIISLPKYTEGSISVKEVYGELLIPLVSDVPFVQQFDLEVGGRYSDYNTAGSLETYKILGDWSVNDWLRFRGGYQLATRAPNLYELFAPTIASGAFSAANDPCTNIPNFTASYGNLPSNPNRVNLQLACAELIRRDGGYSYQTLATNPNPGQPAEGLAAGAVDLTHISNFRWGVIGYNIPFGITLPLEAGNPNLDAEEAKTWTLGAVFTSPVSHPLLDRFSASIDWYAIDLTGTIETPGAMLVYSQCLDPQYNPLMSSAAGSLTGAALLEGNPYCDLINREPVDFNGTLGAVGSGLDRSYDATFTNQGGTMTSGVDVAINWAAEFADLGIGFVPGSLSVNFVANYLAYFRESPFAGAPYISYTGQLAGAGYYDYKTFTTVNWLMNNWSLGLRARYLPEIDPLPTATPGTEGAASHTEYDLFGRYVLNDGLELRAGVDNLLNEDPEVVGRTPVNNALSSTSGNYDILGRRFYIGATARF